MMLSRLLPRIVLRFCSAESPDERAEAYHEMRHASHKLTKTTPSEGTADTARLIARAKKGVK